MAWFDFKRLALLCLLAVSVATVFAADMLPPETFFTSTPPAISNSSSATFGFSAIDAGSVDPAKQISAGYQHTLALKSDGTLWGWGGNSQGNLGDSTTIDHHEPTFISLAPENTTAISASGEQHSAVVTSDGSVWTWGFNYFGTLGDGTTTRSLVPIHVPGLTNVIDVHGGQRHTVALKADGTVWAWGFNFQGAVGDGTFNNHYSPVQVVGLNDVTAISTKDSFTIAIRSDKTAWTWGRNLAGELGDGSLVHRNVPVQVQGLANVKAVSAGAAHGLALLEDGTVWSWGFNSHGQLGDGTTVDKLTPVQVQGLSNVIAIAAGWSHSAALTSDGKMWTWGSNVHGGQLGDGTTVDRSLPAQVPGLTNVIAIATGGFHTLALTADGKLWAWGFNEAGQIGDNTTINRLIPVQVFSAGGGLTFEDSLDGMPFSPVSSPNTLTGLAEGIHAYRVRAIDGAGNVDPTPASYTWTIDITPPVITAINVVPNVLWPPNHRMVDTSIMATSGTCDLAPSCEIVSVASNEPVEGAGDGDKAPDWEVTGSLSVKLRAERSGLGNDRVYTITIKCVDAAGNSATTITTAIAPHDQS